MRVSVQGEPIETVAADWLVVGVFEDVDAPLPEGTLGEALQSQLTTLRDGEDFIGNQDETLAFPLGIDGVAAKRILLVGLGKREDCSRGVVLRAATVAARSITGKQRGTVLFTLLGNGEGDLTVPERMTAVTTGAVVGAAGPDIYRNKKNRFPMGELQIARGETDEKSAEHAVARGEILGRAVNLAREWVNLGPQDVYPESFCTRAADLVGEVAGIGIEVFGPQELADLKMGCILGVGGGSERQPRLLVLRYHAGGPDCDKTLCFVGKGITFDSGGLSIKTAQGMEDMKSDMAGAATVVAATLAVAQLKIPVNLVTITPLAENMPSGSAIRPGDVLTAKNGKTIEIVNTDAEGRLVLADALSLAVDLGVSHIVDLATLTGACVVALGTKVSGVMTNDPAWSEQVLSAALKTGELAWPLPMFEEYDELIKSKVADIKNSGGRWGGAISAAKFLAEFVGDIPWTHVDIAGPSFADDESPSQDAGGTGHFVRTLVELAESYR